MIWHGEQWIILLGLALVFAGCICLARQSHPNYQGNTAEEWFYSIINGEEDGYFLEVIAQGPDTAVPVLVQALEKSFG